MLSFLSLWQSTEECALVWGTEFFNEMSEDKKKRERERKDKEKQCFLSHSDWPLEESTGRSCLTLLLVK